MILDIPIEDIEETDIISLKENKVSEGKTIEYKSTLPGNSDKEKIEFLADISSFANASGGYILYGIIEKAGYPSDICGVDIENEDELKQKIENLLRDCIDPRIYGIKIQFVPLEASNKVLVIRIPRSWNQPHVVKYGKHWRFYSRNSAEKYPLDVSEVKSAFLMSETIGERIRTFRTERLGKIISGETPIKLDHGAKTILHIIPLSAFDSTKTIDISVFADYQNRLNCSLFCGTNYRYNFDGFLSFEYYNEQFGKYIQFFHNGIVEGVENALLNPTPEYIDGKKGGIPCEVLERELFEVLIKFLSLLKKLNFDPPFFIMLSFIGVNGYELDVRKDPTRWIGREIDRNELLFTEVIVNDYISNIAIIMKPVFDALWNAAGYREWMNYEKWSLHFQTKTAPQNPCGGLQKGEG